jgi:hypothetical protein
MGNVFGLVLGSYEGITPPIPVPGQRELPKVPWRESVRCSHYLSMPLSGLGTHVLRLGNDRWRGRGV